MGIVMVPWCTGGYQYPRTGSALATNMALFDEFVPDTYRRSYLQGRLSEALIGGKSYCVSFYVSLANESRYAIKEYSAYLDDGSIDTGTNCGLPQTQITPQITNQLGILTDSINWVKIQGSFVAEGDEKFITLGNFKSLANTTWLEVPNNDNFGEHYSYYFVDDVSVIESDLPAYAGPDVWVAEGDSIFIGRTPEVGLECYWYINGSVIDSGAGIMVHPDTTTTYVVQQTLCGQVKTDTVIVSVFPVSVNGITNSRQLSIYPNPASSELTVMQERLIFNTAVIINSLGQQLSAHTLKEKETKLDISTLTPGIYYLQLNGEKGRELRSFVKMQ
jgi:hypothetical protein